MEYGLIGEKLSHSFSKIIHEEIETYSYELIELSKDELDPFFEKRDFRAINVTIPYKEAVLKHLAYIDPHAEKIGSVNTIVNRNGILYGYNTDFSGMKFLFERSGFDFSGKKVLVLGSGGTAKTAIAVSESMGARKIVVVSRSGEVNYSNVKKRHADAEYIINTTPCGMFPSIYTSALTLDGFEKIEGVGDVVYNPLKTALTLEAAEKAIKNCNGLFMLVAQAVYASAIFLEKEPDEASFESVYNNILSSVENVVLIGMPGCGKSTVGKLLSEKTSKTFVDTDELIIEREGKTPAELIRQFGEEHFRNCEAEAIASLAGKNRLVIATGGGSVLRKENVINLKRNGKLFFLNRKIDEIVPTDDRPLSSNRADLERRFAERLPIYRSVCDAEIIVEGDEKAVCEKITGENQ